MLGDRPYYRKCDESKFCITVYTKVWYLNEWVITFLLPTRSEEREVLWVGNIPVAILLFCQDMEQIALQLHKHEYSWV